MKMHSIGHFIVCSTFLCVSTYAQQSNIHGNYAFNGAADPTGIRTTDTTHSAGTAMNGDLADQRDVFDILKMLFNIDITSADTVSKVKGRLYVAVLPAIGYSLTTQFAVTIGANAAI